MCASEFHTHTHNTTHNTGKGTPSAHDRHGQQICCPRYQPIRNVEAVEVLKSKHNLTGVECSHGFGVACGLAQVRKHLATRDVLHKRTKVRAKGLYKRKRQTKCVYVCALDLWAMQCMCRQEMKRPYTQTQTQTHIQSHACFDLLQVLSNLQRHVEVVVVFERREEGNDKRVADGTENIFLADCVLH